MIGLSKCINCKFLVPHGTGFRTGFCPVRSQSVIVYIDAECDKYNEVDIPMDENPLEIFEKIYGDLQCTQR